MFWRRVYTTATTLDVNAETDWLFSPTWLTLSLGSFTFILSIVRRFTDWTVVGHHLIATSISGRQFVSPWWRGGGGRRRRRHLNGFVCLHFLPDWSIICGSRLCSVMLHPLSFPPLGTLLPCLTGVFFLVAGRVVPWWCPDHFCNWIVISLLSVF